MDRRKLPGCNIGRVKKPKCHMGKLEDAHRLGIFLSRKNNRKKYFIRFPGFYV